MLWAGQYADPETGLIYMRVRYYDPATARFMSRDPITAMTGAPYSYVGDNPLNGTDPTGLVCLSFHCIKNDVGAAGSAVGHFVAKHRDDVLTVATLAAYATCPETGVCVWSPERSLSRRLDLMPLTPTAPAAGPGQ